MWVPPSAEVDMLRREQKLPHYNIDYNIDSFLSKNQSYVSHGILVIYN